MAGQFDLGIASRFAVEGRVTIELHPRFQLDSRTRLVAVVRDERSSQIMCDIQGEQRFRGRHCSKRKPALVVRCRGKEIVVLRESQFKFGVVVGDRDHRRADSRFPFGRVNAAGEVNGFRRRERPSRVDGTSQVVVARHDLIVTVIHQSPALARARLLVVGWS